MRIKIKKKIAFILIPLILFSTISGCFRAPASNGFKISEIALYRTAVIDAPKDVKITHLWSKPDGEDKIIITFNKDVDPSQKTPIFTLGADSVPNTVFSEKDKDEKENAGATIYYFYSVDKNKITIRRNPKYPPAGLSINKDALIIPAEFAAKDGSSLQEDAFFYLNRWITCSMPTIPQLLIVKDPNIRAEVGGGMDTISLSMTANEKRTFAFLLRDVDLVSSPDKKEKLRSLEVGRTNVEILKEENSWTKVAVYYPKYSSNDKEIQSMPPFADFDALLDSNFVERVDGYIPSDSYSIIPRPINPDNFVSAGSTDDVGSDRPVLVNVVVVEGFAHQHEYIDLGAKLTEEQADFLEMETLAFISWDWQEGPALISTTVSGKPVPLLMVWEPNWDDNDYNIFNRVRTEYVEKILNYIDNYKLNPKYEKIDNLEIRKIIKEEISFTAKYNEALINWSYTDKDRKIQNLAKMVSEAIGKTDEEKESIYTTITTDIVTDADGFVSYEGLYAVYNSYNPQAKVNLFGKIQDESLKFFLSYR